jgi:hypothetical protein
MATAATAKFALAQLMTWRVSVQLIHIEELGRLRLLKLELIKLSHLCMDKAQPDSRRFK